MFNFVLNLKFFFRFDSRRNNEHVSILLLSLQGKNNFPFLSWLQKCVGCDLRFELGNVSVCLFQT